MSRVYNWEAQLKQESTALRERISAAYLCQQVLDAVVEPVLSPKLAQQILAQQSSHLMPDTPLLPLLPELHL